MRRGKERTHIIDWGSQVSVTDRVGEIRGGGGGGDSKDVSMLPSLYK